MSENTHGNAGILTMPSALPPEAEAALLLVCVTARLATLQQLDGKQLGLLANHLPLPIGMRNEASAELGRRAHHAAESLLSWASRQADWPAVVAGMTDAQLALAKEVSFKDLNAVAKDDVGVLLGLVKYEQRRRAKPNCPGDEATLKASA